MILSAAAAALAGCQSTQDKSAELARSAKGLARETGLRIGRANNDVAIGSRVVVQDRTGAAAVVELRNSGRAPQAAVPVQVTVRNARGRALYSNTTPGLDASLVSVPVLEPGRRVVWVDNQIAVSGRAAKLDVRVGVARGRAPGRVPRIRVSGLRLGRDSDGVFVRGVARNASRVVQRRLAVYCVARKGGRIVAAGRATIDRLPAGPSAKPTRFTLFLIGNPAGARLEAIAPATVLK